MKANRSKAIQFVNNITGNAYHILLLDLDNFFKVILFRSSDKDQVIKSITKKLGVKPLRNASAQPQRSWVWVLTNKATVGLEVSGPNIYITLLNKERTE